MSQINRRLILASALAGFMGVMPVSAETGGSQEEMRAMMRAWILDEPEIIIEAMQVLEARQRAAGMEQTSAAISENRAPLSDLSTPGFGAADAAVTIVKFSDYRCGHCRNAHTVLAGSIAQNPDIRVLVREFPILGEASEQAARLALAAWRLGGEEAYIPVHDLLFAASGALSAELLTQISVETGIDLAALDAGMRSPEVTAILAETMALAQSLGVQGTPALVIGDSFFGGGLDATEMANAIAAARP